MNIDATMSGEGSSGFAACGPCTGSLFSPVQVTLGAGTYQITDGFGAAGALYDAWRYNSSEWVWHWKVLLDDGQHGASINGNNYNSYILLDVDSDPRFDNEAAAAALGAITPAQTLVLSATTTLDFVVDDYFLPDNAGGVSLNIASLDVGVPEPRSSLILVSAIVALLALGLRARRASVCR